MSALTTFFLALLALFTLTLSAPVRRDVFVPPITYPHKDTIWFVGQHHNVTWDTKNAPANITNKIGQLYLAINTRLDLANPLAVGFDIMDGKVEIQVPNVSAGDKHALVLIGDSGNYSPSFLILTK